MPHSYGTLGTRDRPTRLIALPPGTGEEGTMADDQTPAPGTPAAPIAVTVAPPGIPAAPTPGLDSTVEGGAYVVNGQWVNANGEPIKPPKGQK